jgi:hypothetical protein
MLAKRFETTLNFSFFFRYDLLVSLMTSQLGDIADRKSPAYYIVMRAQEREVSCRLSVAHSPLKLPSEFYR